MKLEAAPKWHTGKERLNLQSNKYEVLLGYKFIEPFDDGIDKEGLTRKEAGPMIIYRLVSREKHKYLCRLSQNGDKPILPTMLVPVYLSRNSHGLDQNLNCWVIRSFKLEFAEVYEKKHWWSTPRLVTKDYLRLCPDISCHMAPEDSNPETVIRYWSNLDQKTISMENLRKLMGLSPETKTA